MDMNNASQEIRIVCRAATTKFKIQQFDCEASDILKIMDSANTSFLV